MTATHLYSSIKQNIINNIHKYSIESIILGICDTYHEEKNEIVVDIYNYLVKFSNERREEPERWREQHKTQDYTLDYNHYLLGVILGIDFTKNIKSNSYSFNEYELITDLLYSLELNQYCEIQTLNDANNTRTCKITNILAILEKIMINFTYRGTETQFKNNRNSKIKYYERLGLCESQKVIYVSYNERQRDKQA